MIMGLLSKPFREITIDELYDIGFHWTDSRRYTISDRLKYEDLAKPDETIYWLEYNTSVINPNTRQKRYIHVVYYPNNYVGIVPVYAELKDLDLKGLMIIYRCDIDRAKTYHCYPKDIDELNAIIVSETTF